jgi:hypothetical protein
MISSLALLVSILSLAVAALSLWLTYSSRQPVAWLELQETGTKNRWNATIQLRNPSSISWQAEQIVVPIDQWPMTDKQNFLLKTDVENHNSGFNTKAFFVGDYRVVVDSGETGKIVFILMRGPLSDAVGVEISFGIRSREANPRYMTIKVKGRLPGASSMQLG